MVLEKITDLLHTFQEPNYALLLELIVGADALSSCASELLVVYYFSKNELTKARAKELLTQLQHPALTAFLRAQEYLILPEPQPYYTVSQEGKLQQKLQQLARIPLLSMGRITLAIALHHQQALGWALEEATLEQQHEILSKHLNGQAIFYLNKNNPLGTFPEGLTQFKQLTHLTFFVKSTTDNFVLPDSLQNCQQLRALHLYEGEVQAFSPALFQQLPQLKSVSFISQQKVDVPALEKAMPHCHFDIRLP